MKVPNSLSICVPTHQRKELLIRFLQNLKDLRKVENLKIEVLICCNGCTDNSAKVAREFLKVGFPFPWKIVEIPQPGLNLARNKCILESRGEIVAFLDDDVQVTVDWIENLINTYRFFSPDIVAGRVQLWWKDFPRPEWINSNIENLLSQFDLGEVDKEITGSFSPIGANMSFRREVLEKTGLFRNGLDRIGNELLSSGDTEWADRAVRAGFKVFYSKAKVLHYVPTGRLEKNYLETASRMLGFSNVLWKKKRSIFVNPRIIMGKIWLIPLYEILASLARKKRDFKSYWNHRIRSQYIQGSLEALLTRFVGKCKIPPPDKYDSKLFEFEEVIFKQKNSKIDIFVTTFKRPKSLANLLQSLSRQKMNGLLVRIVVVDNDSKQSARAVVEDFKKGSHFEITYVVESIQGLSRARNKALDNVQADYFAFLDDDEEVEPTWLITLYHALHKYNADAVFGTVVRVFPSNSPEWIKNHFCFKEEMRETGQTLITGGAGNVLLRSVALGLPILKFDTSFDLTGSEDVDFFYRLYLNGKRFVWCNEGIVYERITPDRLSLSWVNHRLFGLGQCWSKIFVKRLTIGYKITYMLSKLIQLTGGILFLPLFLIFSYSACLNLLGRICVTCGNITGLIGTKFSYKTYHSSRYRHGDES